MQAIVREWRGIAEARSGNVAVGVRDMTPWIGRWERGPLQEERKGWLVSLARGDDPFTDVARVKLLLDDSGY